MYWRPDRCYSSYSDRFLNQSAGIFVMPVLWNLQSYSNILNLQISPGSVQGRRLQQLLLSSQLDKLNIQVTFYEVTLSTSASTTTVWLDPDCQNIYCSRINSSYVGRELRTSAYDHSFRLSFSDWLF